MAGAPGSFANLGNLRDKAQGERAEKLAVAEAEKQAQEEAKKKAEIAAKPAVSKPVIHLSGIHDQMTEDQLFEKYADVIRQVKEKSYFLSGYVTYGFQIGTTKFQVRTLKKSENRLVSMLAEGEMSANGEQIYHPDDLNRWTVMMMLMQVGQQTFEVLPTPSVASSKRFVKNTEKTLLDFVDNERVKQRLALIDNWATPIFSAVAAYCLDVTVAFQRAVLGDIANPS